MLIQYDTSEYFSLNRSGTLLWELISDNPRLDTDIASAISTCFEADEDLVFTQVKEFLDALAQAKLVIEGGTIDPEDKFLSTPVSTDLAAFDHPELVKCGDLETLILSGE